MGLFPLGSEEVFADGLVQRRQPAKHQSQLRRGHGRAQFMPYSGVRTPSARWPLALIE